MRITNHDFPLAVVANLKSCLVFISLLAVIWSEKSFQTPDSPADIAKLLVRGVK